MANWYRRLAEVPNVGYEGSPGVDRTSLPGADSIPHSYDGSGLWWPTANGSTSTSPARGWKTEARSGETAAQTALREAREKLELPGTLDDYLSVLGSAAAVLERSCGDDPTYAELAEQTCLLAISLLEHHPHVARDEFGSPRHSSAFGVLVRLYLKEGYLNEAKALADRAGRFGQETLAFDLERRLETADEERGR